MVEVRDLMTTPIPDIPPVTPDIWKTLPIKDNDEPLLDVQQAGILTDSIYAAESTDSPYIDRGLAGSTLTLFAREEVVSRLASANSLLPQDMGLVVMDAWRSFLVQKSLFDTYYQSLEQLHPDWNEAELLRETQNYVSYPSLDPTRPSPHNTGGAVDVLIYKLPQGLSRDKLDKMQVLSLANLLDIGVPFDHGGEESAVRHFEEYDGQNAETYRQNRRLLYWIMKLSGFAALPSEIWHYNFGNQMAAQAEGSHFATYGAIDLSNSNKAVEEARRKAQVERLRSNFPTAVIIKPAA